jgi:sugar phosphate permease
LTSRAGGSTTTKSSPPSGGALSLRTPAASRRARVTESRWRALLGASAAQIGLSFLEQGLPALLPYLKSDLGLTSSGAGAFGVSVNAGRAASGPLSGSLVHRHGPRKTLLAGSLTSGTAGIAAAAAPAGWLTLVLLVVGGLAQSAAIVAGITGVGGWFADSSRGIALGLRQAAVSLGGLLAAATLPVIALEWGWRPALAAAGIFTIATGYAGSLLFRDQEPDDVPSPTRLSVRASTRIVLGHAAVRRTLLVAMTLSASQYVVLAYVQLYFIESLGLGLGAAAAVRAATQAAGMVGRLGWGTLSDLAFAGRRTGVLAAMLVLGATGAAGLAAVGTDHAVALGVPFAACLGLAAVGAPGMYVALLADVAPSGLLAATMGTGLTFILGAAVVVPPVFGVLVDAASYRTAWVVLAGLLVVNVPVALSIAGLVRRRED